MKITVERPDEDEVHLLISKYGKPLVREFQIDLNDRDEIQDYPECKGGTRIAVKKGNGIVLICTNGSNRFGLPGGRIWVGESVEDGAVREVLEETGLEVELKGMPELHKCQYVFRNWNLERWIFIFTAIAIGGSLEPIDKKEIHKAAVFQNLPPSYEGDHWLGNVWNECLDL